MRAEGHGRDLRKHLDLEPCWQRLGAGPRRDMGRLYRSLPDAQLTSEDQTEVLGLLG